MRKRDDARPDVATAKLITVDAAVTCVSRAHGFAALISRRPERRQLVGKVAPSLALDPLRRQLTADIRDSGSTHLSVLIALQTFPVRSGAHILTAAITLQLSVFLKV